MQPDISFLITLSKKAGQVLMEGFGKSHQVEYKGPIDVVTEVDRQAENLIVHEILSQYPDHTIIAEEGGFKAGADRHSWFIDPVDGTSNYAKGLPIFCVSIAYACEGVQQIAVVYDPTRDECFYAERGLGAWLNGVPILVSQTSELIDSMLVTGFPYELDQMNKNVEHFIHLIHKAHTVRRLGSAVLDQVYVATGRLDGYWEVGVSAWDIAAGTLIIEEAGGLVTRLNGDRDYMKPPYDIVAANPVLHAKLLAELMKNQ